MEIIKRKSKIRFKMVPLSLRINILFLITINSIKFVNSSRNNNNNDNNMYSTSNSNSYNSNTFNNADLSNDNDNLHTNSIQKHLNNRNYNNNNNNNNYIDLNNFNIINDPNSGSSALNVIDSSLLNQQQQTNKINSCQTVCACKWKGGKQTVECIDRSLIRIPENIDPTTQVLDMSGNNLQNLVNEQFLRVNLLNLQKLFLRNCKIGEIQPETFKGLTNLVELDLSHNLLVFIPANALSHIASLRDLTLASNHIHKIESHSFRNTPSLNKLDLSHCDIQTIAPQAFEGLDALHSLKLNGNKLSELRPKTIETLSRLHGIELHDNPWMCDCRLRAAKIWLTEKNIPYPVAPVCSGGPERIIDRTFADLQIDDFACKPEMLPVNRYVEATMGDNATIKCRASAIPAANINWYWNGRLLINGSSFSSYQRVYFYEDGQFEKRSRLILTNSQETDSSEFYCVADNRAGTAEANFTLHVSMRAAGMASLGSGQIVGLSAALVILILFILLIILFMLIRLKRQPYIESKTPNHLEVITTVNNPNSITTKALASQPNGNVILANGGIINTMAEHLDNSNSNGSVTHESKLANPVQKPPRLTDLSYTTGTYDGNGSVLNANTCFISPTASAGNNPDLINDTKRFGSEEFSDLKIPAVLAASLDVNRPGSGEYSRAGGCDSLYPSGLWESNHDDPFLKRANSTTIPGYGNYTDRTPIIDNKQMYDLHERTVEYFSRTFPRTHFQSMNGSNSSGASTSSAGGLTNCSGTTTITTALGAADNNVNGSIGNIGTSGYPSDYGLPLVPGAEQQIKHNLQQHGLHQFNNNNLNSNNSNSNNSINNSSLNSSNNNLTKSSIVATSSSNNSTHSNNILPNGMPVNAKTIRVWQKGGVPVLPPVTALKRALISNSRNSPDEGYQEGCGTDV